MSVLQRFEKRLENLVEGAFAKVFKGVVHPVEILNAMQREAQAHKAILGNGRTLVPNRYIIDLSPTDHERIARYAAMLAQELAQAQAEHIGEQGWAVYGDVIVEIERGERLDTGMFRVSAEVYTGGIAESPPSALHGYPPPPVHAPAEDAPMHPPSGGAMTAPLAPGGVTSPPPQYRQARLISLDGRQFMLTIGSTVLGRGEGAQVRLPDVGISRQHARIDFDGNRVVLSDLGSTNGTSVNGNRVNVLTLQHGDVIQLGTTSLTFRLDG